jgi:hypothetical protein
MLVSMLRGRRWAFVLVAVLTIGFSVGEALAGVSPRAARTKTESFALSGGPCETGGQICPTTPTTLTTLASYSNLKVVFTLDAIHCSDVAVVLFVDGHQTVTTPFAPPGVSTESATVPWPKGGGDHTLGYEGEGKVGGCNSGALVTWSGGLAVTYTPKENKVVLSGSVFRRVCIGHREPDHCQVKVVGDRARSLTAVGDGHTYHASTNSAGGYSFKVKPGHYTIRVDPTTFGVDKGSTDPKSRSVDAQEDVANLDFSSCKMPEGYRGECGLARIVGRVVDVDGAPYASAIVFVGDVRERPHSESDYDDVLTDRSGNYDLFTTPDTTEVSARDAVDGDVRNSINVDLTRAVTYAPDIKLVPELSVTSTAAQLFAQAGGLPLQQAVTTDDLVATARNSSIFCRSSATVPLMMRSDEPEYRRFGEATVDADSTGFASFCPGAWTAFVRNSSGRPLVTTTFTVP